MSTKSSKSPKSMNSPTKLADIIGKEIGRGGFGIVYETKNDPTTCIKISNKMDFNKNTCRQWSNEYEKINQFINIIEKHPAFKRLKMVRIVKPRQFIETEQLCYMTMPRIYRPEGKSSAPTIQAQLGVTTCKLVHKGRGEFIGLEEIKQYVSNEDLEIASRELGIIMALIHFVGKNDAYDIEVFLGKEANTKKVRFYIADFDLSSTVPDVLDEESIRRIAWSMDAVPYFPRPSVDPHLFQLFINGYKTILENEILISKMFEGYE